MDSKGRLITLDKDKTSTRIVVVYPRGSEKVLADTCEGSPLPEPNDLIADRKGGIYFTAQGVFYMRADGTCINVHDETQRLNGIQLSRDEKILYVTTQGREPRTALTAENHEGTDAHRRVQGSSEVGDAFRSLRTGVHPNYRSGEGCTMRNSVQTA
jgi:sugar lactone lactonase YvrE